MSGDFSGRIRYLALAAFAQNVIDALAQFIKSENRTGLGAPLNEAKAVVDAFLDGRFYTFKNVAAIGGYDQYRVVERAWFAEGEAKEVQSLISSLQKGAPGDPKGDAEELLAKFLKLQRGALWCLSESPAAKIQMQQPGWRAT